jgi:cbb3-type cytochrome oxidase subunit 1
MRASSLSFQTAVVLVLAGMIWGIIMAISQDHSAMTAHAHLNLLGWVSLFIFGIFYHLHPTIDRTKTAMIQVCAWIAVMVILAFGVALIHTGHQVGEPIAAVASMAAVADMLVFGWLVFRWGKASEVSQAYAVPAE